MMRWVRQWPGWAAYAAAAWSLLYGAAGLYWTLGGAGYPFARVDLDHSSASFLEGAPVSVVGPAMALFGLAGAVSGLAMARGIRSRALTVFGWASAVVLALLLPDYSLLAIVAFSPLLVVFAFTGVPGPQDGIGDIIYWHRENLVILFVGGLLWAAATLAHQRRTAGRCVHCGRSSSAPPRWTTPESARRWGRQAVFVAILAPLTYEVTRVAWFFGIPLGISREFLRMMQDTPHMLSVGLLCALGSTAGGVLTHGLIDRWGEVYPRWIWFRAGRRVPPMLAVVPATLVALVLVPAGFMATRMADLGPESWAINGPGIGFTIWGLALGAATLAYHLRRRGTCRACGRGADLRRAVKDSLPAPSAGKESFTDSSNRSAGH